MNITEKMVEQVIRKILKESTIEPSDKFLIKKLLLVLRNSMHTMNVEVSNDDDFYYLLDDSDFKEKLEIAIDKAISGYYSPEIEDALQDLRIAIDNGTKLMWKYRKSKDFTVSQAANEKIRTEVFPACKASFIKLKHAYKKLD
jgi:hypothetical protein